MQDHEFVFTMSHEDWMALWHIAPEGKSMSAVVGEVVHNYLSAQQSVQSDGGCTHPETFVQDGYLWCAACNKPLRVDHPRR
jgi:hypothetical protein